MTARSKALIKRLDKLIDEIMEAAIDCGHRDCPACRFNLKCAAAMEAAIKELSR